MLTPLVVCARGMQSTLLLPLLWALHKWQLGFLAFLYLVHNLFQLCMHAVIFSLYFVQMQALQQRVPGPRSRSVSDLPCQPAPCFLFSTSTPFLGPLNQLHLPKHTKLCLALVPLYMPFMPPGSSFLRDCMVNTCLPLDPSPTSLSFPSRGFLKWN